MRNVKNRINSIVASNDDAEKKAKRLARMFRQEAQAKEQEKARKNFFAGIAKWISKAPNTAQQDVLVWQFAMSNGGKEFAEWLATEHAEMIAQANEISE